jgi:hypothetical protein
MAAIASRALRAAAGELRRRPTADGIGTLIA